MIGRVFERVLGGGLGLLDEFVDLGEIALSADDFVRDRQMVAVLKSGHGIEIRHHGIFEDAPEAACARFLLDAELCGAVQRLIGEVEIHAVDLEHLFVLLDEGVLGFRQNTDQRVFVERMERRDDRQTANEFGNHAELEQVFGLQGAVKRLDVAFFLCLDVGIKADGARARARLDDILKADERAAADEEDVRGIDADELLLRMLAAAFGRHGCDRALDELEERLLDTLARDIARDRRIGAFARDLVDLVDVDDASAGAVDIAVGGIDEVEHDVFDIVADVSGFGQAGGIRHGKRHVKDFRKCLGEQGLACSGRADQEDVRFSELDAFLDGRENALVVVVHSDRKDFLGVLLLDDVFIELGLDILWLGDRHAGGHIVAGTEAAWVEQVGDLVIGRPDTLLADIDVCARNQALCFAALFVTK